VTSRLIRCDNTRNVGRNFGITVLEYEYRLNLTLGVAMLINQSCRQAGVAARVALGVFLIAAGLCALSACSAAKSQQLLAAEQIEPTSAAPGQPWLDTPVRLAAQTVPQQPMAFIQCRVLYAAYGLEQHPAQHVTADEHRAVFAPAWPDEAPQLADLAYSLFTFDMTYFDGPAVISLNWEGVAPPDNDLFVGLGNFVRDRWDWRQPVDSGLELEALSPYIDANKRLLLAVALTGSQPATLNYVRIGDTCVVGGVDLTLVFPPPMEYELQATRDDWAERSPLAVNFQLIDEETDSDGFRYQVVSHEVDGYTHYGAVRLPPVEETGPFYVAVGCHAGAGGCGLFEPKTFDMLTQESGLRDRFIIIAPSFRSENLNTSSMGTFTSTGPASLYDRDADDAIAMLDCLLTNYPQADDRLIIAFGLSRGAQVSTRIAERDPRIHAVAAYCGFTDEWSIDGQAYMYYNIGEISEDEPDPSDFYPHVMWDLRFGSADVFTARRSLLLTSTAPFAEALPFTQLHYGELDPFLPIRHGERLDAVLTYLDKPHQFYRYANGGHELFLTTGGASRFQLLLNDLIADVESE